MLQSSVFSCLVLLSVTFCLSVVAQQTHFHLNLMVWANRRGLDHFSGLIRFFPSFYECCSAQGPPFPFTIYKKLRAVVNLILSGQCAVATHQNFLSSAKAPFSSPQLWQKQGDTAGPRDGLSPFIMCAYAITLFFLGARTSHVPTY